MPPPNLSPCHEERAKSAGYDILLDIKHEAYGARGFSRGGPKGDLWNFGAHEPWKKR